MKLPDGLPALDNEDDATGIVSQVGNSTPGGAA